MVVKTYASNEGQCIQSQPFHCTTTQCIMNNVGFLPLAVRCGGFHDKEGTDRDVHCLNDNHIGKRDEFCTYQAVDPGNYGRQYLKDLGNKTAVCLGFYGACLGHSTQDRRHLSIKVCCSLDEWVHDLAEVALDDAETS